MDKYKEYLELVAKKETTGAIVICVALLLIAAALWVSYYFHNKNAKVKHPQKYNSPKQVKQRRQGVVAAAVLTCICVVAGIVVCAVTVSNVTNINRDISESSYFTYSGKYYISQPFFKNSSFDQRSVDIGAESLTLRFTSISEWAETDGGEYEGTVTYGQHSGYVVDIEK